MTTFEPRQGMANRLMLFAIAAVGSIAVLVGLLYLLARPISSGGTAGAHSELLVFCAAGIRSPVAEAIADYQRAYGVSVLLQYGGSNTLLSQIEVGKTGDLYLAGDDSYITLAREKGLVEEAIPVASMRPVIAVRKGNPKGIHAIEDLLRDDVKTSLGNPDQSAIGKTTRKLLRASGHWDRLEKHVTETGVFKPTVPEVANDVKIGSIDAGIVWNATVAQYSELEEVRTAELDAGVASITIGVLTSSRQPAQALHLARYLSAREKGLLAFQAHGYETVDGDTWAEAPELTFYCGSVNRRAVESVIRAFELREGVRVNTLYNGCGILTAQMRMMTDQQQSSGFPDTYMACDTYYLDTVKEMFQEAVNVSETEVVIAVPKGNPKNVTRLRDLTLPGVRVAVGQPDQCTIGVITRQLLTAEGIYDEVMKNVVTQTVTSAFLIPSVTTGSVDAVLAYATDTLAESDKVDVIRIDSPAAKAVQPFGIARSSQQKYLARRLYQAIAKARDQFESAGFHWKLDGG